ncbi:RsiV family protein [Sorangium sp. So ce131]|uniref:RsiV family protein n=1 Tax=Sorangium sp. So ce131 TaxID=3133282 RepID=UPI003F61FD1B
MEPSATPSPTVEPGAPSSPAVGPGTPSSPYAGLRYAVYEGTLGDGAPFDLVLEWTGAQGNARFGYTPRGSSAKRVELRFEGAFSGDRGALSSAGPRPSRLSLSVQPDGVVSGAFEKEGELTLALNGRQRRPFRGALKHEAALAGTLGKSRILWFKLKKDGAAVTGLYRYGNASQDLLLSGSVTENGDFVLEERNEAGALTGKLKGVFVSPARVLGTWWSPDESKTLSFDFPSPSSFVDIVRVGGTVRIYPVRRSADLEECSYSTVVPQLAGTGKNALERSANRALDELGRGALSDDWCDGAAAMAQAGLGSWSGNRTYSVTGVRRGHVGLRFSESSYQGGAHDYHESDCVVLDTTSGRVFRLYQHIKPAARAQLDTLVAQALDRDPNVQRARANGFPVERGKISEGTDLCVNDQGLAVHFGDYELASYAAGTFTVQLQAADVYPLFDKAVADVLFR